MLNYVFLCDSPELDSGFANVGRNILERIELPKDSQLYVWGLGHNDIPYVSKYPIYTGGIDSSWRSEANINRFRRFVLALQGDVVLVTIQDCFRLNSFSQAVDYIRSQKNLKIVSYIPVDSYLIPEDVSFLGRIDIILTYTEFGKREIEKYTTNEVNVIPHGLEPIFKKNTKIERNQLFPSLANNANAKLLISVNSNSQRKAPDKSLEILKNLLKYDRDYYLYMHMHPNDYVDLKELSKHLEIEKNVIFADPFFGNTIGKTACSTELLSNIYSSADLYISTSCGEGWGLTAFEAGSCETPIAVPKHSSYEELIPDDCCVFLPTYGTEYFMNKRWPTVDTIQSAKLIHNAFENNTLSEKRDKMNQYLENRFNWDEIVQIWNNILWEKF